MRLSEIFQSTPREPSVSDPISTPADIENPESVIVIAMGANLPTETYGQPADTLRAAVQRIGAWDDLTVVSCSPFYETAPVPVSDQPWYVNGVIIVATACPPGELLHRLHEIEAEFGRVRRERNAARVIDLDLIAYERQVIDHDGGMQLPHPRMHERAFVLMPLRDVVPNWTHPVLGQTVEKLIDQLPGGQGIRLKVDC